VQRALGSFEGLRRRNPSEASFFLVRAPCEAITAGTFFNRLSRIIAVA
jgi:hypothetical protein